MTLEPLRIPRATPCAMAEPIDVNLLPPLPTAPHSAEEKALPLTEAPSGIIGLETALALGITQLVKPGYLSLLQLMEKMSRNPARLYGLPYAGIAVGAPADLVLFDENEEWTVQRFHSKASNSPFLGKKLTGRVRYTVCGGKIVYEAEG